MTAIIEKFTLKVTDVGFTIHSKDGNRIDFSPVEAIMLLDILQNEAKKLKKMAEDQSPLPMEFNL